MNYFDTSSLLLLQDKVFDEPFIINYTSITELENIKTSSHKDNEIKYKARNIVRLLNENIGKYKVSMLGKEECIKRQFDVTNDNIILCGALLENTLSPIVFYTNDLLLRLMASGSGLSVGDIYNLIDDTDDYLGYKEVTLDNEEMAYLYEHLDENKFECLVNEYVVVNNSYFLKWDGNQYIEPTKKSLKTALFGDKIKPKDFYQRMVVDSIFNNMITCISGEAGSGKTLLSLICAMQLVETGKYERIVILFNPTSARGASQLGYYSGSMIDKAMQTSIGNILVSKIGDKYLVDSLICQNKIKLISMADSRGLDISDNEILFVSEVQNTSVDLIKLCLTRASEGCKVIIEGDYKTQVDSTAFENNNNGMMKAIDILKGEDIFGYIKLKNVYRSKLAELASKM